MAGERGVCCDSVLHQPSPPFVAGPGAGTEHLSLDPAPASVRAARTFVRDALGPVDEDTLDTVLLLSSELVTNAIQHARTPVELCLVVDNDQALVCVADGRPDMPVTRHEHSGTRPGGRGLALVDDLSERWGTTVFTGGKTVWFTMPTALPRG